MPHIHIKIKTLTTLIGDDYFQERYIKNLAFFQQNLLLQIFFHKPRLSIKEVSNE